MKAVVLAFTASTLLLSGCAEPANSPAPTVSTPEPAASPPTPLAVQPGDEPYARFAEALESLRRLLKIPGLSAAIVKDQELVWAGGFGYSDLEKGI